MSLVPDGNGVRRAARGNVGHAPVQGAHFAEFVGQAFPLVAAIDAAEQLAQVGAGEQQHGIGRMRRDAPQRAVEPAWKRDGLPGIAMVRASQQAGIAARGPLPLVRNTMRSVSARGTTARVYCHGESSCWNVQWPPSSSLRCRPRLVVARIVRTPPGFLSTAMPWTSSDTSPSFLGSQVRPRSPLR